MLTLTPTKRDYRANTILWIVVPASILKIKSKNQCKKLNVWTWFWALLISKENSTQRMSNLHPRKHVHTQVSRSFIHNCKNLEAAKMPFRKGMDKHSDIPSNNGMLKRNELSSHENIWRKPECILLSERSQSEKAKLYDSNDKTF